MKWTYKPFSFFTPSLHTPTLPMRLSSCPLLLVLVQRDLNPTNH